MSQTIFHKIRRGEIPADIVYEDEHLFAFRDIAPQAPVHVLFVPKADFATLNDVPDEEAIVVGRLATAAARYARAQEFAEDGYRIVMNCNRDGGQTVFQIHLHLLAGAPLGRFGTPARGRSDRCAFLQRLQHGHRMDRLFGRNEEMIVHGPGHHIAADPGLRQRLRERRGQADRSKIGMHLQGDPGGGERDRQAKRQRIGFGQHDRETFGLADRGDDLPGIQWCLVVRQGGECIATRLQRGAHSRQQPVEVADRACRCCNGVAFDHQLRAHRHGEGRVTTSTRSRFGHR